MLVHDAIPRTIDTTASLGVSTELIAKLSSEQILKDHPDLEFPDPAALRGDIARLLEALSLSIELGDFRPFEQHARWLAALHASRGLPNYVVQDMLLQLRRLLVQSTKQELAVGVGQTIDQALVRLREPKVQEIDYSAENVIGLTSELLLTALLRGDRDQAFAVIDEGIRSGLKVLDTYVGVIKPVMEKVGRLWLEGSISVSDEHVATALVQSVMAHCRTHFRRGHPGTRGTIALTGVHGELHDLGARVVGDVAEADGWTIAYLGTNAPTDDTLGYLRRNEPEVIGISVTMPYNLSAATTLVEGIRSDPSLKEAVVYAGGLAASFNTTAWNRLNVICENEMDAGRFVATVRKSRGKS